jgi:hypothetical protein
VARGLLAHGEPLCRRGRRAHEERAEAYERALTEALSVQGRDALWDHLFEDGCDAAELARSASRPTSITCAATTAARWATRRANMMARWIAWAMAQPAQAGRAQALVVCGGYHAPALARLWPGMPAELPATPGRRIEPSDETAGAGQAR